MKSMMIFIAIVWLIIFSKDFSFSEDVSYDRFVDKKVAGLVIGEDGIEKVTKLYGRGVTLEAFHGETLCYYDANEETYFIVASHDRIIESITLSKEFKKNKELNQCKKKTLRIENLATSKGVRVGDSQDKIIKIYGEPHKKGTKDGMLVFEYHTDSKKDPQVSLFYDAYLHFRGNKLVKLVIHDGE